MEPHASEHGRQFAAINQSGCVTVHGVAASSWARQLMVWRWNIRRASQMSANASVPVQCSHDGSVN